MTFWRDYWPAVAIGSLVLTGLGICLWDIATKPTSGVVVTKKFVPSHTTWVWVSHGKNGGGHLMPIFHGDDWELLIDGDGEQRTAWVSVSPAVYEAMQAGSRWAAEGAK